MKSGKDKNKQYDAQLETVVLIEFFLFHRIYGLKHTLNGEGMSISYEQKQGDKKKKKKGVEETKEHLNRKSSRKK